MRQASLTSQPAVVTHNHGSLTVMQLIVVDIHIAGHTVKMEVDDGAKMSIIPKDLYVQGIVCRYSVISIKGGTILSRLPALLAKDIILKTSV